MKNDNTRKSMKEHEGTMGSIWDPFVGQILVYYIISKTLHNDLSCCTFPWPHGTTASSLFVLAAGWCSPKRNIMEHSKNHPVRTVEGSINQQIEAGWCM